jgi:hypothetical protein
MTLRDALSDYKRHEGHETKFPGERRSTTGLFAGDRGRLVHVTPDGSIADFGYPLSGLSGLRHTRLGVSSNGDLRWFGEGDQSYYGDTTMVRTTRSVDGLEVKQYDLTVEGAHVTAFETDGDSISAYVSFTPNGRTDRVGHLRHGDAVEVYHSDEHDFLASATGIDDVDGAPLEFGELLAPQPAPVESAPADGRYEEGRLTGDLLLTIPVVDGFAAFVTLLSDLSETDREAGLARARDLADRIDDPGTLAELADDAETPRSGTFGPADPVLSADLRVLELLSSSVGLRIAGPEFDPFYAHSGGYGYTWFRDDAQVARHLLSVDRHLDVDLADWHRDSAEAYCETQLEDGTWPHRVWAFDGSLAPGWANARLEAGSNTDYQADQTASVVSFLADYLADAPGKLRPAVLEAVDSALEGMDDSLDDDGRPVVCQNAWENLVGRFAHTAATFLDAYSRVAAADVPDELRRRAIESAHELSAALDDIWVDDRGIYALRETPAGDLDDRLDSSSLALVEAHRAYDRVATVDDHRIDRLVAHVDRTVEGLYRETGAVSGLVRFEGDHWRSRGQDHEKIWTVSTGEGAHACASLASLLEAVEHEREPEFERRARGLLEHLWIDGPLCVEGGYLPEQFYDDGRPDSATPLGWSHAIRSATVARLTARDALRRTTPRRD